jgi:PAS domain S-box-containing protein
MATKVNKEKKDASQSTAERERERLAHLASFPELNPNPVVEVDLAGHFHYLNPATKRLFPDLQRRGLNHVWLKDLQAIGAMLSEERKGSYTRELRIGDFWYHQSIIPVLEGKRLRIFGFNITARMQAEEALRNSEERYRGLYEAISGGIIVQDRQGTILGANAAACEILGLTQEQLQARTLQDPRWRLINEDGSPLPNDDRPAMRALRTGIAVQGQVMGVFNPALEQYRWLLVNAEPILDPRTSQVQAVVSTFLDITDRKKREEELGRLNRTLTALSNSSKAMMRATNEAGYLQEVCKIVVEDCGHQMVWIGFAEEDEGKTVRPVAHAGFEEGYLETLHITWADTERGRGPTGTAIRTGTVSMCRNMLTDPNFAPWREQAIKRGYASSIVLPLTAEGKAFGALNIYAKDPDPFSDDEVKLLSELADDLAHGITTLRLRAAHAQTEEALRRSEERLRLAQASANVGVWDWNPQTRELTFTPELEQLLGVSPGTIRTYRDWSERVLPDDLGRSEAEREEAIVRRKPFDQEFRIFHATGEVRWISAKGGALYNEAGEAVRIFGVLLDITERKRAEETLRQSREDLDRAQEVGQIGWWRMDVRRNVLTWSDENHRIFGIPAGTPMRYETFLNTVHPEDREYVDRQWEAGLRGEPYDIEHRIVAGEEVKWVREKAYLEFDDASKLLGGFGITQDITDRKQAEEALLISEIRYRRLFEAARDGILILDVDSGQIVDVNPFIKDMLGYSHEELLNKKLWEIGPFKNISESKESFLALQNKGYVRYENMPLETKDGRHIAVEFVSNVYLVDHKKVIQCNIRDITGRVRAEEALQKAHDELEKRVEERTAELKGVVEALQEEMAHRAQAEEDAKVERQRLYGVLETLPAYVVLLTQDYHIAFANHVYRQRFGESQGKRCFENLFNRREPCENCETYTVLKTNAPHHWEWLGPDSRTYEMYDYPFTDVDGSTLILKMGIDITGRKQAEQERMRLIAAVEQSNESIVITDEAGKILYANTGFSSINDYSPPEAMGKNYFDILTGDGHDKGFKKRFADILGKGSIWKDHFTRKKKDGSSYELDVSISPVRDQSGRIINYSIIERDVTHEVVLEQHLRQQQKMEALGTLAGGIAHDFNNILMPIMINTELSLYDIPQTSPVKQYLNTSLQAAQRGQELVKQILAFSRQKEQERTPIKITPVVKETLKFLKATTPQQIEIREHFDAESGMILADPTQIHQVLMNLCNNAVHAMREKGGVLEVSLADVEVDAHMLDKHIDLKPGPHLKLTVSDTGSGMDQETAKRIFEPFFTTKKPGEGTGMGLAVVHGIVKRHEGAIVTYSEPDKGSTFHIFFPRIEGEPRAETAEPEGIPTGKERILFIDDEEAQARSGRHLLERLGYDVTTRTDSLEALEVFRSQPDAFDLVITDQRMPVMTGIELAEKLMHIRSDIPIILCTGFSEVVDGKVAKAMGIREFMMKPFPARQLAETIRRVLGERD